jgi:hypothetical protein
MQVAIRLAGSGASRRRSRPPTNLGTGWSLLCPARDGRRLTSSMGDLRRSPPTNLLNAAARASRAHCRRATSTGTSSSQSDTSNSARPFGGRDRLAAVLITPRPGVDPKGLLETLRTVGNQAVNLRSGGQAKNASGRLLAYLEWTGDAVRMLGNQISNGDLTSLVLTSRHAQLLGGVGNMTSTETEVQRVVNGLVLRELDERVAAFEETVAELRRRLGAWKASATSSPTRVSTSTIR